MIRSTRYAALVVLLLTCQRASDGVLRVSLATDEEDVLKRFAAHSDQERVLEDALYKYLQFQWKALSATAFARR